MVFRVQIGWEKYGTAEGRPRVSLFSSVALFW